MTDWGTLDVYASKAGHAYHQSSDCRAFLSAQDLSDWDCGCDEYCRHRSPQMHAIQPMTIPEAMGAGKLPCLVCLPGLGPSWFRTPCEDDFGHEPVDEYQGTPEGERGVTRIVCARCMQWTRWPDVNLYCGSRITWPCTSALVLGLVPRPGICPDCQVPMDAPAPGSSKCPDCDDNERLDALGAAL